MKKDSGLFTENDIAEVDLMRIAIVGISIEIMLSNPVKTEEAALQHCSPEEMREGDVWMVRGMMARLLEESDIEPVPLGWVTALPGGPLASKAYQGVKTRALRLIEEQGPFDGILVANHGALEIEGLDRDGDTDFIESIRRQVGADVPIGVALDLHGDMTPDLLRAVTVFSVLRTASHRDDKETGYRAADQVLRPAGPEVSAAPTARTSRTYARGFAPGDREAGDRASGGRGRQARGR